MKYEFTDKDKTAILGYTNDFQSDRQAFSINERLIQFIWNRTSEPVSIEVDDLTLVIAPNQIITTTFYHQVHIPDYQPPLSALLFNREFYCIVDHDSEVSCNGILFFGTQDIPIIQLEEPYIRKFNLLLDVFLDEFKTQDNIQNDMLLMLLKRFIILCTRLAKQQNIVQGLEDSQIEIIRQFNVLVDMHFREKKQVKAYAQLLHRSPKTLSNLFATYNHKTPQRIIQERTVLEAKRLLKFTNKQNQEIAYDLGFEDPAYFSRYFKKIVGMTPSQFKMQVVK